MFQKARLTLTLWYVAISMLISISFSVALYSMLAQEVYRFARVQHFRLERAVAEGQLPPQTLTQDEDLETETLQHIQIALVLINSSIFMIAGVLCYLFAGKTLKPIQEMVDEQHRFVSDASHELRTPLTALRTTGEVALRNPRLSLREAKELIRENLGEISNLQTLSEALLKLSSYENQTLHQHFTTVELNEVAQSALKKVKPLAQKKKIQIQDHLSHVTVDGVQSQLSELIIILLDNAIKYSPRQSTISFTLESGQKETVLTIMDQGIGISPADLPHIFDRFYRSDKSRSKTPASGYGLGLAIAKQIVVQHHGRIDVESKLNQGSIFRVFLPLKNV